MTTSWFMSVRPIWIMLNSPLLMLGNLGWLETNMLNSPLRHWLCWYLDFISWENSGEKNWKVSLLDDHCAEICTWTCYSRAWVVMKIIWIGNIECGFAVAQLICVFFYFKERETYKSCEDQPLCVSGCTYGFWYLYVAFSLAQVFQKA